MNELEIINNQEEIKTIDSREVAEMMEIEHSKLIRKIEGINEDFRESKIGFSKYWIENTYKTEGQKREYKNFLITKRGCEFLSHKFTGKKGNLFTDKYMDKFAYMEEELKQKSTYKLPSNYKEALLQLVAQVEANEELQIENESLSIENRLLQGEKYSWANTSLINSLVRTYSSKVHGDFSRGWNEWKKNLLYRFSININSRITSFLNTSNKKTKPKTLSMLKTDEEISNGIITILTMCKEENIDVSDILKHQKDNFKN